MEFCYKGCLLIFNLQRVSFDLQLDSKRKQMLDYIDIDVYFSFRKTTLRFVSDFYTFIKNFCVVRCLIFTYLDDC